MLVVLAHATAPTGSTAPPAGRTCRVGASIVPGACHVGARGLGMLGADIMAATAIGEHGAGLMFNDGLAADREYRLVITNSTFGAGALIVFEDGSIDFGGTGTATQSLYESSYLVNTAALDAGFLPPEYAGTLPALTQARTMAAFAAGYAAPSYSGLLAGLQMASSMPAIAGTYAPPGVPVLPALQVATSMPAIAGSYAAPTYSGALGSMVAARAMPAVAGTFSGAEWTGTLGGMVAGSSMPAVAGSYGVPTYAGQLPAMATQASMPGLAALYSTVAYNGVLAPMTAGSSMPAFTFNGFVPAWLRALREYTLLAPVDQIDNLGGFAEKDPAARVTLAFEFKRFTSTPDSATVGIAVWRGADGDAENVLDGEPAILGTKVYQRVKSGVHDTDYKLTCMLTDAGGQAYVLTGVLPVRSR